MSPNIDSLRLLYVILIKFFINVRHNIISASGAPDRVRGQCPSGVQGAKPLGEVDVTDMKNTLSFDFFSQNCQRDFLTSKLKTILTKT